ncbi:MAG: VIT1/CCC1 transporter family protein, partial [Thiobacillus sp.]
QQVGQAARQPLLNPVDRVSELIFGLFMALTFVGVVSMATADRQEIEIMLAAALGCNIAWGLVDAVMYLVRTITDRGRLFTLVRTIRGADPETGRRTLRDALSSTPGARLISSTEIEAMHGRLLGLTDLPARPKLQRDDLLAALGIFLIVVASTFPVALPFVFLADPAAALLVSRVIAVVMLFFAGLALGRYAGYGSWKTGVTMAVLGVVVVAAVIALGG